MTISIGDFHQEVFENWIENLTPAEVAASVREAAIKVGYYGWETIRGTEYVDGYDVTHIFSVFDKEANDYKVVERITVYKSYQGK